MMCDIATALRAAAVHVPGGIYSLTSEEHSYAVKLHEFFVTQRTLTTLEVTKILADMAFQPNMDGTYRYVNEVNGHLGYMRSEGRLIPSPGRGDLPAVGITWWGAKAIAAAIGGRLPTEAEWEVAARSGMTNEAWVSACTYYNQSTRILPVPSADTVLTPWGLADCYNNVRQWCADWYHPGAPFALDRNVQIEWSEQVMKTVRGASYNRSTLDVRSDLRSGKWPFHGGDATGIRVVFPGATVMSRC